MKEMVIMIKRIPICLLLFVLLINIFPDFICNAKEGRYYNSSCRSTIYVRDVPIDVSVRYSYEEDEENFSSFKRKRIIRIESCSSTCRSLDYTGSLTATASYTDTTIYVSIYGPLKHKRNSEKNFTVSETQTINII